MKNQKFEVRLEFEAFTLGGYPVSEKEAALALLDLLGDIEGCTGMYHKNNLLESIRVRWHSLKAGIPVEVS